MSRNEASREAFEKWLTATVGGGTSEGYLKRIRRKDGSYSSTVVNAQWLAWQANTQPPQGSDATHEAFGQWWMMDAPSLNRPSEAYEATRLAFRAGAKWARSQALEEAATLADDIRLQHLASNDPEEDLIALGAEKAMCAIRVLKEQK